MNLPPHPLPQGAVHELVAREAAQLRKLARDDPRREVGTVVRLHLHLRTGKTGPDEARNFFWVHGYDITWGSGKPAYNDMHGSAPGGPGDLRAAGR